MAKKQRSIIDFFNLESPYVTEFDRLLYYITQANKNSELKSILLTSAMLSEGKSTICSFMGITASLNKGIKTLIIDADLRRPSIHRFFQISSDPGLTEILSEAFNPREAVVKTDINKLDILPAGSLRSNPSEIFDSEAIGTMVEEMKFYYDLILVDSPPLIPVSDPMMLTSYLDKVLLVVKSGSTQKEVIRRAMEILSPEKKKIMGVVLNNVNQSLPYHYNYSYYHYEYNKPPKGSKKAIASSRSLLKKNKQANPKNIPLKNNISKK